MLGLSKLLRLGEGRAVKRLEKIADQVIDLEDEYSKLTDEELKAKTDEFKKRVQEDGEDLDDILLEAFATAREASRAGPEALQGPDHGWRRPALRLRGRDENR